MNDTEALIVLVNTPFIGAIKARLLIQHFGSPTAVLEAPREDLMMIPGVGGKVADSLLKWQERSEWKHDLELIERQGVHLISWQDKHYPSRLLELPDHPILLYVWGNIEALVKPSVAVVGTRNASIYGMETAGYFSSRLAGSGLAVISGLARGIDTAAHRAALKSGVTVAVLGSGIGQIYPKENEHLAKAMTERGAVISEFPMAAPPDRQHFPQRNRIVAGISLGTLLIEAPAESGAMLTMERAGREGRHLWAIPGRCDAEHFRGNHRLIKEGKAQLVEKPEEILSILQDFFPRGAKLGASRGPYLLPLEPEELNLYNSLNSEERTIDEIAQITHVPIKKLNILLVSLVLKRAIREYPGKIYKKVPCHSD